MPVNFEQFLAGVAQLLKSGDPPMDASVEYPGCLFVRHGGNTYVWGTVNKYWDADLYAGVGDLGDPMDKVYTNVASDCPDTQRVADAIRVRTLRETERIGRSL